MITVDVPADMDRDAYITEVRELAVRLAGVPGDDCDAGVAIGAAAVLLCAEARTHMPLEQVLDMVRQAWTSIERSEAAS